MIIAAVSVVILESIGSVDKNYGNYLRVIEWIITGLFTIEYILRIYSHPNPVKYIFSFWGLIDLISFFPTYLSIIAPSAKYLTSVRILRLMRVFRILKLMRFIFESQELVGAIKSSMHKIAVFFLFLLFMVIILGSMMYAIEQGQNGFNSIPQSIYWAIITITTVGYGDIVPVTPLGKFLASFIMIIGYSIIAVPTGIITSEMTKRKNNDRNNVCPECKTSLVSGSKFCHNCGKQI